MPIDINEEPPKTTPVWIILACASLAVLCCILIGAAPFYGWFGFPDYEIPDDANEYGDAFGFANVVVSAFAFAALVVTMFWQREELQQQRWEIMQMRKASQDSANAQRASHEALLTASNLRALESLRQSANDLLLNEKLSRSKHLEVRLFQNQVERSITKALSLHNSDRHAENEEERFAKALTQLCSFVEEKSRLYRNFAKPTSDFYKALLGDLREKTDEIKADGTIPLIVAGEFQRVLKDFVLLSDEKVKDCSGPRKLDSPIR